MTEITVNVCRTTIEFEHVLVWYEHIGFFYQLENYEMCNENSKYFMESNKSDFAKTDVQGGWFDMSEK